MAALKFKQEDYGHGEGGGRCRRSRLKRAREAQVPLSDGSERADLREVVLCYSSTSGAINQKLFGLCAHSDAKNLPSVMKT